MSGSPVRVYHHQQICLVAQTQRHEPLFPHRVGILTGQSESVFQDRDGLRKAIP